MVTAMTSLTVAHLMTPNPVTIRPDDTMSVVRQIFRSRNIHHVPVVDKGKVVGIVTKSDFLALSNAFPLFNEQKRESYNEKLFSTLLVEEVMTRQVAKVQPGDSLDVVAGIFKENLFHALPVVDNAGKLVGIITTFDLLSYFFTHHALID